MYDGDKNLKKGYISQIFYFQPIVINWIIYYIDYTYLVRGGGICLGLVAGPTADGSSREPGSYPCSTA